MLRITDVAAGYGRATIIHDISLDVADGEAVALLGRNGVGKTTLMKCIMGVVPSRGGRMLLDGAPLPPSAPRRAKRGLGYVPQGRDVFPRLTVAENIEVAASACGRNPAEAVERMFAMFPVLARRPAILAGSLSGGQQQMLAIARALATDPKLLLLDEPTEGVQPSIVDEIEEMLTRLNREHGVAMLLAEQNLDFAAGLAGRFYVMDKGTIAREVLRDELLHDKGLLHELLAV